MTTENGQHNGNVLLADIRDQLVRLNGRVEIANARSARIEELLKRVDRRLKKKYPIK